MKRFITIAAKHGEEILILMRNAAAGAAGADAYLWLKNHLQQKQIPHNDQNASHQNQLPHQGGYISFVWDENGKWVYYTH